MALETAQALIRAAAEAVGSGGMVQFTFQGGEPTLAGLDFFRAFLSMEKQYPGVRFSHSLQTNGMHVNGEWADFLRENRFLVGLSVDGTKQIHDRNRVDASGSGSWSRVTGALALLDAAKVETNLLCVVTAAAAKTPQKVYASMKNLGNHPLQFIPCLDPMENRRGGESYSLTPALYGRFLCSLFDCWYRDWKTGYYVSIRTFDDYLRILMGQPPSACAASGSCGSYLTAEADGSLYPCDFYVLDNWRIGNIRDMSALEALTSPIARQFVEESHIRPAKCRSCQWFPICRGGCKRDWTAAHENYYCEAFRVFFPYAFPRLREAAQQMRHMR